MNIAGVEIGPDYPTRVVAEIGNSHNGDIDRAIRLLDAAKASGCDLAKLQCYTPDELVALRGSGPAPEPWGSQGWDMWRLYDFAKTPLAWFPALFDHARSIGLPLFSSVFGRESLAVLEACGCPAYKIAALDNQHAWLLNLCLATKKPTIVSNSRRGLSFYSSDMTLYCPPGYPQDSLGLTWWPFSDYHRGPTGFSYHGTDPLAPVVAATLGATIVEFHFHLEAEPSALEAHVSLHERQTAWMVSALRRMEAMRA